MMEYKKDMNNVEDRIEAFSHVGSKLVRDDSGLNQTRILRIHKVIDPIGTLGNGIKNLEVIVVGMVANTNRRLGIVTII